MKYGNFPRSLCIVTLTSVNFSQLSISNGEHSSHCLSMVLRRYMYITIGFYNIYPRKFRAKEGGIEQL
jgi:hypothetical protein